MAGLEIAGLILGTIPILAATLDSIQTSRPAILFHYYPRIQKFKAALDREHVQFRFSLERILEGIVDDSEFEKFVTGDISQSHWKDKEKKLKQKLGREIYSTYIATLGRVADVESELWESLDLESFERIKKSGRDKLSKEVSKRFKAFMQKKRHDLLLREMQDCNKALRDFTHDHLVLESIRVSRYKSSKDHEKWEAVQQLAKSLHDVLENSWTCECTERHLAQLLLERSETDTFDVHFSFTSEPLEWRETQIKIEKNPEDNEDPDAIEIGRVPSVSFSVVTPVNSLSKQLSSDVSSSSSTKVSDPPMQSIEAFCDELRQCRKSGLMGYLDDKNHRHYIEVFPRKSAGEATCLGDDLRNKIDGSRVTDKEKYQLAVILANSILQLHHTHWLDEYWSNQDVYISRRKSDSSSAAYEISAFVQREFRLQKRRTHSDPSPRLAATKMLAPPIRNLTIFALGITLIELSIGKPLESCYTADELASLDTVHPRVVAFQVANRVLREEVSRSEAERYTKIANRCINCVFEPLNPSLDEAAFRQAFYEHAVKPLQDLYFDYSRD